MALLPVGLTLGWLFLSRRSLYAAIGLHAAFNAIQVLALLAVTSASLEPGAGRSARSRRQVRDTWRVRGPA